MPAYLRSERVPRNGRGVQYPYGTAYVDCAVDPDYAGSYEYLTHDFWHPEVLDAEGRTGYEARVKTRVMLSRAWVDGMLNVLAMYLRSY